MTESPSIPSDDTTTSQSIDWYQRRDELRPGMTFTMYDGDIVMLDRTVPGDASAWIVLDWDNGWKHYENRIEPCDLREQVPDPSRTSPG